MLTEWANDKRALADVRDVLYKPMAMGDMAGSMFVRDVELANRIKLDANPRPTFLELPFAEAVQFFEQRFADPARALEVIRVYRDRADDASKRTLTKIAKAMIKQLTRTLAEGGTLDEFTEKFEGRGFDNSYLENVYRTNIQTAYGAGRVREIEASADVIPFVEYVAVMDGERTRIEHQELDGKVWKTSDQAWKQFAPPCGFQCRCSTVTREEGDFDPAQLARVVSIDLVDPRFRKSPTAIVTEQI